MKPLIGITSEVHLASLMGRPWNVSQLLTSYSERVAHAGGAPVILPLATETPCRDTLERLDGLILSGGNSDVPPEAFGENPHPTVEPMPQARWDSEVLWLTTALELDKPVLGICLGMQVMNVVAGGKIIQDIPALWPGAHVHGAESRMHQHEVNLVKGTRLAALAPAQRVTITSSHHQAVASVPAPYRLAATSDDGVIEAMESTTRDFVVGVQWHPERNQGLPMWLLEGFVRHCAQRPQTSVS